MTEQDLTKQKYRAGISKLVKDKTGLSYKDFQKKIVNQRLGELVAGGNKTRTNFDKKVVNDALYDLLYGDLLADNSEKSNATESTAQPEQDN